MIVVVKRCSQCPFCAECNGEKTCNLSVPKHREVVAERELPGWCPLNREQVIVKNF
ncbi:MAG: hypothetical protein ACLFSY_05620 [Desulfonatronovibrionaceae bacterium]